MRGCFLVANFFHSNLDIEYDEAVAHKCETPRDHQYVKHECLIFGSCIVAN